MLCQPASDGAAVLDTAGNPQRSMYGCQIQQGQRRKGQKGNGRNESRYLAQRRIRQEGDQEETGDSHWAIRGSGGRQESASQENFGPSIEPHLPGQTSRASANMPISSRGGPACT